MILITIGALSSTPMAGLSKMSISDSSTFIAAATTVYRRPSLLKTNTLWRSADYPVLICSQASLLIFRCMFLADPYSSTGVRDLLHVLRTSSCSVMLSFGLLLGRCATASRFRFSNRQFESCGGVFARKSPHRTAKHSALA